MRRSVVAEPGQGKPPKEVTAAVQAQLGAVLLAARTVAKMSQAALALRLKTLQANILRLEIDDRLPGTIDG